jgi:hypothetical protein
MEVAAMTGLNSRSRRGFASVIGAVLIAAAPVSAQDLDTSLGVEALALLQDGRIVVRNGEDAFDCALLVGADAVTLGDCRQVISGARDVTALLSDLTDEDWQGFVRETLQDAQCRLSAFEAVADIVAAAAAANGIAPDEIDRARAALAQRADDAVAQMLRDGRLTYRDGELALDACP